MLLLLSNMVGDISKFTQRPGRGGPGAETSGDQGHASVRGEMTAPGDCNQDTEAKRNVMLL